MLLRNRIEYLRRERAELLHLANRMETTLLLAARTEFPERTKSLADLRQMEHGFSGIGEHCRSEERILESIFRKYLNKKDRTEIAEEHEVIVRLLGEFREELKFASIDRAKGVIVAGNALTRRLRAHLLREKELLNGILRVSEAGKPHTARKRKKISATRVRPAVRNRKRPMASRAVRPNIPYTMEYHPEL